MEANFGKSKIRFGNNRFLEKRNNVAFCRFSHFEFIYSIEKRNQESARLPAARRSVKEILNAFAHFAAGEGCKWSV